MTRFLLLLLLIVLPVSTQAQIDYIPLVGIPGVDLAAANTLGQYIDALYIFIISIAALIAVVRLVMAGVKYILSDVINTKESAKKDIKTSLLGLLIVLGAVLILETINPQLTNLTALDNLETFEEQIYDVRVIPEVVEGRSDLMPDDDERLELIPCAETELGDFFCDEALTRCGTEFGGSYRTTFPHDGSVLCYIPLNPMEPINSGYNSTCDGYFDQQTQTCFGTSEIIEIGSEFNNERNEIRQMECMRLGGNRYEDNVCYRDF